MPPHDWWTLIVSALAVYRLAHLATADTILDRPRNWIVDRGGKPAEFVVCPWCVSIWLATGVVLLLYYEVHAWPWVALVLALSALTGLISAVVG